MKKILAISTLMLFSSLSVAEHFVTVGNYRFQNGTSTLRTEFVDSKESAYQKGHSIMSTITNQEAYDLSRTLRVPPSRLDVRSVKIDTSYVTVRELSRVPGEIEYQGLVVVSYHYRIHKSDN
ncbi:DUF3316 domain-containing protein [Photobacterium sp. SDRW27]|uniref:DUF3316 domain-containing protein n=1 Tax=Photobacterium obscurum TaxID=2829490 RepID=UPI002242E479|nr:DUF3316 domain-containing protein [Photobacterium obscurum]MCW8328442.1 DUF3316 domain-containing protein [Photobacterium obscurum]